MLCTDSAETPVSPDGRAHLLDWACTKQKRVMRSTFSAELNGIVDSGDRVTLIQLALYELWYCGEESAWTLVQRLEGGTLRPGVDCVCDAKSVFDAINASDVNDPQESPLKLHVIALRDKLERGILKRLWWSDTRDMLADGLTKGGIPRDALVQVSEHGVCRILHETAVCTRKR